MKIIRAFSFAFILFAASPLAAQNYIGISGGFTDYDSDSPSLGANGVDAVNVDSTGFMFFAGGQWEPRLGFEFAYTSLFDQKINSQTSSANMIDLSLVLRSPGAGFEPFLRAGLARISGKIGRYRYDENGTGLSYGLGGDIHFTFNSALRLEYRATRLGDIETSGIFLGSLYRF